MQEITSNIAKELGEKGATQDELNQVQKPLLKSLDEYRKSNGYWTKSVMNSYAVTPKTFDWALSMSDYYAAITLEDVNELANKVFSKAPLRFSVVNESSEE